MEQLKYWIITFGCQMNVHDSEVIAGQLTQIGYKEASALDKADIIIFNTCCVRENPERKLVGQVDLLRPLKQANPRLIIGICGCMVQQSAQLDKIRKDLPHVDLVFGTHNIHRLPELLNQVGQSGERIFEVWDEEGELVEGLPSIRKDGLKAFINIIYGCTNFCTYCIVPRVRGKERSRQPDEIQRELQKLVDQGFKEVTLLGQNVNAYGKDLQVSIDFAQLLQKLNQIDGLCRIRFTTSHPRDVSQRLINAMASLDKVCEHLHLPLQAGSNAVLNKMNRGYTNEEYLDLVANIKQAVPHISLTTDLIVGFPGESEKDFQETLRVVEAVQFDSAFTFIYSPREGTAAATMANQVPEEEKKDRIYRLIQLQNKLSLEKNMASTNTVHEVLVEGASKTDPNKYTGRNRQNKLVVFTGGTSKHIGQLVQVQITHPQTWILHGQLHS